MDDKLYVSETDNQTAIKMLKANSQTSLEQ